MSYSIGDFGADLLGSDRLGELNRARQNKFIDLITNQGLSPDEAQKLLDVEMPRGKFEKGLGKVSNKIGGYIDDAGKATHQAIFGAADKIPVGKGGLTATRLAGNNPVMRGISKAIPVLGATTAVLDAGDIFFGQESAANKVMDGAAMAIGGTIGGVLGMGNPLLAAAGASTGKFASDSLQWLFGDKRTAEQRKMEEALAALQGRYI